MANIKYFKRTTSESHNYDLSKKTQENERLLKYIKLVFNHQKAVYDIEEKNWKEELQEKKIAKQFYEKYYNETYLLQDGNQSKVSISKFVEDIFFDRSKGNKNNLNFLLGKVGVGKTSLINNIITNHKKFKLTENRIWLVRLDFTTALLDTYFEESFLLNKLVDKTKDVIKKRFYHDLDDNLRTKFTKLETKTINYLKSLDSKEKNDFYKDLSMKFADFVVSFFEVTQNKLVIIIDNIDAAYHQSEIGYFQETDDSFIEGVFALIATFLHGHDTLGGLYANIIFVMRNDTYNFIKGIAKTSGQPVNVFPYRIVEPDWDEIINKRFDFLTFVIETYEKKNVKPFKELAKEMYHFIVKDIKKEKTLINQIRNITNFGLRDLMDYFAKYIWISYNGSTKIDRLMKQQHVGLIAYFLGGKRLYSGREGKVPNLFSGYLFSDKNTNNENVAYWLKYLMISYVNVCNGRKEVVTDLTLKSIFCGEKGYSQEIVNNCLDQLCDSNTSNIFHVKKYYKARSFTKEIVITKRGQYILDNYAFIFSYLQLIIDDPDLYLPRLFYKSDFKDTFVTNKDYAYLFSADRDYTYLLEDQVNYTTEAKKMIETKGKAVYFFLVVLKEALEAEKKMFPKVFELLEIMEVSIPNMNNIINRLYDELEIIDKSLRFTTDFNSYRRECESKANKIKDFME